MEGIACQLDLEILFIPSASAFFWLWDLRQGPSLSSTIYQTEMVMMTPTSAGVGGFLHKERMLWKL